MATARIEREAVVAGGERLEPDLALDAGRQRYRGLVDPDHQRPAVEGQRARADPERLPVARQSRPAALGHGPAFGPRTVEHDVEGHMVLGIGSTTPAGTRVIGREHAADEGDHGDAVPAVGGEAVDIPPDIAIPRHRPEKIEPLGETVPKIVDDPLLSGSIDFSMSLLHDIIR
jgi:hypothetical protein